MRTTITLNDKLYRALKLRAVESDKNISTLVEQAITYQLLEDLEDLEDASKRDAEPSLSFDKLVKQFKNEGLL
jgi:hypothetical protein